MSGWKGSGIRANSAADSAGSEVDFSEELSRVQTRTDEELLSLAARLAFCRPLEPWPRQQYEYFIHHQDEAYQLRMQLWERLFERGVNYPLEVGWYCGSRLTMQLGNENSRSFFVNGAYDANEFAFLDRYLKPGMCFLDAGAHEGIYGLFAALKISPEGQVWALEPSERERTVIQRNVERNGVTNVHVLPCALGESEGVATLRLAQDSRSGHNTLGSFAWDGVELAGEFEVPVRSLDGIVSAEGIRRLDVIKMDIEGAETAALRGGSDTLRHHKPIVIVEVSEGSLTRQGSSSDELLRAFEGLAYDMYAFDADTGLLVQGAEHKTGDNLVAVPKGTVLPEETLHRSRTDRQTRTP